MLNWQSQLAAARLITLGANTQRTLPPRAGRSELRIKEHPCAEIRAAMELAREILEGPQQEEPEPPGQKELAA